MHARWLNRDPIGEAEGINLYAYSRSSPLTYTDASGLVANPVELTCVDPVQPACWLGVLADIATDYGLFVASAGAGAVALATPGDTSAQADASAPSAAAQAQASPQAPPTTEEDSADAMDNILQMARPRIRRRCA